MSYLFANPLDILRAWDVSVLLACQRPHKHQSKAAEQVEEMEVSVHCC